MPETPSNVDSLISGLDVIIKAAKQSAQSLTICNDIRQLLSRVRQAEHSLNTANRLLELKAQFLDVELLSHVQWSISYIDTSLNTLRDRVEGCRTELEERSTIGLRNRTLWATFRTEGFISQTATLTNAISALNQDISRMENMQVPTILTPPPKYAEIVNDDGSGEGNLTQNYPISPSVRRKLRRERYHRSALSTSSTGLDGVGIGSSSTSPRPTPSTMSFPSSAPAGNSGFEGLHSDDGLIPVSSELAGPFELPANISLGYVAGGNVAGHSEGVHRAEDWEKEKLDNVRDNLMMMLPPPVPPKTPLKPKAPRRRSNLI